MFSIPLLLLLLSTQIVAASAAPLLETISPTLVTSHANSGASPLNATALSDADASAQASLLADVHSIDSSHLLVLSPPRHATRYHQNQINPIPSDICDRNTTIGEIEDVEYNVPGTQTTLHMSFRQNRPIERRSLGGFLLLMRDEIQAHISASGDGPLLPEDDPYRRDWPGFYFISKSSPLPAAEGEHHLTYGIMDNTLRGLFDIMYIGAPNADPLPFGCYCNMEDGAEEMLGTAVIWATPISIGDA